LCPKEARGSVLIARSTLDHRFQARAGDAKHLLAGALYEQTFPYQANRTQSDWLLERHTW
jgi:hypothetical protein